MPQPPQNLRPLFSEAALAERIAAMARQLAAAAPENLLVAPVLAGAFMFAADFLRALHREGCAPEVDFLQISSYGAGTVSSGALTLARDLSAEVKGRDVLLIDDILETGRTLAFCRDLILARGARKVMIAVLLDKPGRRAVEIAADLVGFECPDVFVVGYGMDHAGFYRQLPFIGVVEAAEDAAPEDEAKA